jgi:hypothetical protein
VDAVGKTNENDGIAVHIGCDPVATLAQGRGGSLRQYNTRETVAGFSKDPNCDGDHQIAEHFTKKSTAHAQLARAGKTLADKNKTPTESRRISSRILFN